MPPPNTLFTPADLLAMTYVARLCASGPEARIQGGVLIRRRHLAVVWEREDGTQPASVFRHDCVSRRHSFSVRFNVIFAELDGDPASELSFAAPSSIGRALAAGHNAFFDTTLAAELWQWQRFQAWALREAGMDLERWKSSRSVIGG